MTKARAKSAQGLKELVKTLPAPKADEKATIDAAQARYAARPRRVQVAGGRAKDGSYQPKPTHNDLPGFSAQVLDAFGTTSRAFAGRCLAEMERVVAPHGGEASENDSNTALALLDGLKPANEVEALLAVQMMAAHDLAMTMAKRAKHASDFHQMDAFAGHAAKMMRTFAIQTEALAKLRRKGEQTMRVEHVHVHPGAQAVVGQVAIAPGGGGGVLGNLGQPHEAGEPRTLVLEAGSAMWSPEPGREPVPEGGLEGEDEMSASRRRSRLRRSEG